MALTRALAVDHVGDGIRVNAVCPGTVDTPWVHRLVEEAGESLDDLRARQPMRPARHAGGDRRRSRSISPPPTFVTGSVLVVDGGLTAA